MNEPAVKVNSEISINVIIEWRSDFTTDEIQSLISLYLKLNHDNRKNITQFLNGVLYAQDFNTE